MDDPVKREWAMSRLQILQGKLNKGESFELVEDLIADEPDAQKNPKQVLKQVK